MDEVNETQAVNMMYSVRYMITAQLTYHSISALSFSYHMFTVMHVEMFAFVHEVFRRTNILGCNADQCGAATSVVTQSVLVC